MDSLSTIVEYHEQVLRSIENQLGQVVENLGRLEENLGRLEQDMDKVKLQRAEDYRHAQERMAHTERYLQRAFRQGVAAMRRERKARQEADRKIEERREADRREWQERHARIEQLIERSIRGANGSAG